jgi:hypothetical protein
MTFGMAEHSRRRNNAQIAHEADGGFAPSSTPTLVFADTVRTAVNPAAAMSPNTALIVFEAISFSSYASVRRAFPISITARAAENLSRLRKRSLELRGD